jgi:hypothetical protein
VTAPAASVESSLTARTAPSRPGRGLLVALLLLLAVEAWLHSDTFLHRYRSVFAAGRAVDKVMFAEQHCPSLLLLGNSRTDNGFDPRTIQQETSLRLPRGAFNLGLPGADSRVMAGIVRRLDAAGCLREGGTRHAVIVLDEALLQPIDTLGQAVFFAGARQLWADGQYHDALRASLRLYGYTDNLRQLREPATLQRFFAATWGDVDPVGGGAAQHLGYRAGFGGLQDSQAAQRQDAGSKLPPDSVNVRQLRSTLDLLSERGVRVAIVFPPLLARDVLYLVDDQPAAAPYRAIAAELRTRGLPLITLDDGPPRDPAEFVNPGHLNDRGAQRYSRLLARELSEAWGGAATVRPQVP